MLHRLEMVDTVVARSRTFVKARVLWAYDAQRYTINLFYY